MQPAPTAARLARLALGSALALALTGGSVAATAAPPDRGTDPRSGAPTRSTGVDTSSAIVQLSGAPLSVSPSVDRGRGKQIDAGGTGTTRARSALAQERNALKAWLRTNAPKAKVTGEYDVALNAVAVRLNGTSVDTLRAAPGVTHVGHQSTYRMLGHQDPDLARVDALQGWSAAGATSQDADPSTWAGYGIQVAIVDSGVDVQHPCFDDAGFPTTARQQGDLRFTNNKVIVAEVFNNKATSKGYTAEAVDSHGTHVAGTVACDLHSAASVQGADIPYDPSGVAPGAQLGSYNVFPGDAGSARSEDILDALQAAAEDGMDVVNMSLGGGAAGNQDLLTVATDNLDRAGIVVAVAAGNDGPGYRTVGSPGSAERALTAGASSVGHFVGTPITANGATVSVAAIGDFPTPAADLTAPLDVVEGTPLGLACTPLTAGSLTGEIALVSRGACSFSTKVANAEGAGAVAVIVVNSVPGDPIAMALDPAFPSTIPAVMSALSDREALRALAGMDVTIGAGKAYTRTANDDILAGFSSWGPTDVSYRVKPDVVAPGVNVLSSVPLSSCANEDGLGCWAFFQGTSMATPHLAGMSAVVRAAHPTWDAAQVRSAIINTAKEGAVKQTNALTLAETDVQKVGSGLADLDAAVNATVALSAPSTSFGAVPSGSGKTLSSTVTVTNLTAVTQTLPVSVQDSTGAGTFAVAASSVTLAPGASTTVTVTFAAGKRVPAGPTQAFLRVGSAHSVLYASLT